MPRGPKPRPTALRRRDGNPGKRGYNREEPIPPDGLPDCPVHLSAAAEEEWYRLAGTLHGMGVLTVADRAAFAAYCQAYGRWVEAEEKLSLLPPMVKTPSGYVQQNPWIGVANKQLELMGRFAVEFGLTPSARSRVAAQAVTEAENRITAIEFTVVRPNGSSAALSASDITDAELEAVAPGGTEPRAGSDD